MAIGPFLDAAGRFLTVVRRVDRLFESQDKLRDALVLIEQRLRVIEDQLLISRGREDQLVTEARSAASAAATMMSSAALNDIVTRLTRVEVGLESVGNRAVTFPGVAAPKSEGGKSGC